jgi:hypothetical protein
VPQNGLPPRNASCGFFGLGSVSSSISIELVSHHSRSTFSMALFSK